MNKKIMRGIIIAVALILALVLILYVSKRNGSDQKLAAVKPFHGDIKLTVSTVGTVKPQNRLEIKPPINGRIERILVEEGQEVKAGDILAFMSSTERATLIDAARIKGDKEFKYWQNAYKETPLVAPIDGIVIVRDVEPGQTVTASEAVLVLSDRLIVEADVDETDIGEIKLGQKAAIELDAYPEIEIDAVVDHISYESEVVNNVTIYKVDILPINVPEVFRSGMSANVEIMVKEAKNALLIPSNALIYEGGKTLVFIKDTSKNVLEKKEIKTGLEYEGVVEVESGILDNDIVFAPQDSYVVPKKKNGSTPFFPSFKGKEDKQK